MFYVAFTDALFASELIEGGNESGQLYQANPSILSWNWNSLSTMYSSLEIKKEEKKVIKTAHVQNYNFQQTHVNHLFPFLMSSL